MIFKCTQNRLFVFFTMGCGLLLFTLPPAELKSSNSIVSSQQAVVKVKGEVTEGDGTPIVGVTVQVKGEPIKVLSQMLTVALL
jgi:hypothetical protein